MRKILFSCVILSICTVACYKESDFDPSNRDLRKIFTLTTSANQLAADGSSRLIVFVKGLPDEISDSDNHIILTTDFGTFEAPTPSKTTTISSSLVFDSSLNKLSRQASINLISDTKIDSVHLTATVKGVVKNKTIYFYQANPNRLTIVPSVIYAKASFSPITVDVNLMRDTGLVSVNTLIDFTASDTSHSTPSHDAGAFQLFNPYTDASGKCHFVYFFTDSTYQGAVKFRALTKNPFGQTIGDSINLIIYK